MEFTPHGVCSKNIHLEVDEAGRIHNVEFTGGCNGNLQGIGRLVEGMDIHEAISRIEGIKCGYKATSCPDQLSLALKEYLNNNQQATLQNLEYKNHIVWRRYQPSLVVLHSAYSEN